ncbi:MAG: methyltransferase family protein [Candidatus Dormibacteria bacterium]
MAEDPEIVAGVPVGEMAIAWVLVVLGWAAGAWLTAQWSQTTIRIAAPILLVGGLLALAAVRALGKGNELVTCGPYRWVRHPYYLGVLILLVGVIVATRSLPALILLYPAIRVTIARARREEHNLALRYGEPYLDYHRRVAFLLPLRPPLPRAALG